ncbi:PREDICTED: putative late blight resistance protein homolog R1A-3 isoform X3 [Ipomoea nil]|uniref:putative late blight resistance protein homolog R1A-3 isoform X3 n=1 Tax=Ipomoea nil TaxID=35883 RepID=UPI0009011208|nr:PREDICTED: putative late blight resistance protein homolog R1A-3 isoform X3 [Ipomoea nil]
MACVALTCLMRTLELEFLQPNPRLILDDHKQLIIHSLCKKLSFLQTFVEESEKKAHNCDEDLIARIRGVALEAEYDIEAELVEIRHQMLDVTLRRLLKDVEHLIVMIEAQTTKGLQTQHPEESSLSSAGQSSSQHASKFEDTMVGQTKEFEEFKEKLLSSNKPLQVMSLVGMGGIGKTTFARKLANDSAVKRHFDCCGWATMSQEHTKRQVLLQLCRSVMPMHDDINTMKDDELAEQLRKSLLGHRYLIIVDDIWTEGAWDDVKGCFPEENTGSRILLTTRLKEVSKYACLDNLHDMRFLNCDESWNLFCQKFLSRESLNKEFETIGKEIVKRCAGLPLTVVVLAGHLSTNMAVDEWRSVKSMLNSLVNLDLSEQFSRILSLSYKNLPCHLKSCFLYFGVFPEDREIGIKKLIRLWIAEGFIKEESEKTLEESGEDYLQDLINRSLIMVSGQSKNGKVETCKMHDLLHELCASKAKTEKLLCSRYCKNYYIQSDGNRWLSLKITSQDYFCLDALKKSRSILCFDMRKWDDSDWYLNSLASSSQMTADSFKMLRVLDLTGLDYKGSIPSDIIDVVLLRYLALASNWLLTSIPVSRNRNLQTLVISEDFNGVRKLPDGMWELAQLRHLQLYHQLIPMYTPEVAQLNLQTMYWLQCVQCTKQVLLRIPNVKELGIIAQGCRSHRCLDNLNCLNKLEKLKVEGTYCPIQLQSCTFPQNLKEITFAKTLMPWEAMNVMSMLPKLEVLKLKNHACVGQDWELSVEKGFPELKLLIISVMDLKHWELGDDVDDHPFPKLERLVLRNCFELKEMPSWIENHSNLKSVQLEHCHASLVTSARMIEEDQRQLYGEEFALEILDFHTLSDEDQHSTLTQISLPLCHSFAEENDEDIKTSVFLEARSLYIPHANNPRYWSWTRDSGHKVAVLLGVCWLEIKGKLETRLLHKITSYSAYLIFKLKPKAQCLDTTFTSVRYIKDKRSYNENRRCQVFLAKRRSYEDPGRFPNRRHDGWMEIKLGDFYISSINEGEVEMRLWSTKNRNWKSGLIVKGIEVRPS